MKKIRLASFVVGAGVCLVTIALGQSAQNSKMAPIESAMVKAVDARTPAANELLVKIVNINSGTMNLAGVIAVKDVIAPQIEALGFKVQWMPMQNLDGRAGDLVGGASLSRGDWKMREADSADRAYGYGV
jgi:glutamate carboxypeptidase